MSSASNAKAIGAAVFAALAVAAIYLALAGSSSTTATASTSDYCGGQTMGAGATCAGTARNLNAVYGSGDQHSVCVGTAETGGAGAPCSGGPSPDGVYASFGSYATRTPLIRNNGGSANTVHGTAFQP
ncbi:hypothetical protein [Baekduia sp. Peel2402]|uniref:hypothetical protein n=1 Tax=Baekduia sp. Peel2402 TaxID=3458296 RepID=UPI00403EA6E2